MFLQSRPRNWILCGIVALIIGYGGLHLFSKIIYGATEAILSGIAIAGWVIVIAGIVKLFKKRGKK
jgi:hypothetical protein